MVGVAGVVAILNLLQPGAKLGLIKPELPGKACLLVQMEP